LIDRFLRWKYRAAMKKIGLVGGLSWVSTAAYYRILNERTQAKLAGVNSARIILESLNRQQYVDLVLGRNDEAAACEIILNAARSVEAGGAAFVVICCNDAHRFIPEIERSISIPFLHIAKTTAHAIRRAGLSRVALMGVKKTMEEAFYPNVLAEYGIDTIIPNDDERDYIDNTILEELVKGVFLRSTKKEYAALMRKLYGRGADGIVLGCTEIPLLIGADDVDVPTFSTTEIHCYAAIEMALA